jgi:nucleotide sugar dehydrogenase
MTLIYGEKIGKTLQLKRDSMDVAHGKKITGAIQPKNGIVAQECKTMVNEKGILIIGLGEIGYSDAQYLSKLGILADGFDISQEAVQRARREGIIRREARDFEEYDYYMVCISTHNPKDMFQPQMDGLYEVAKRISREGKTGALIAIESTVTQGASQRVKEIVNHRQHVAHIPHRYFALERDTHGVRQLRVLGGCEQCCTEEAKEFYTDLLKIPLYSVPNIEYAELCKIIENTERFLRISFAEELCMFCDGYGLSFDELRNAVNTKWNAEILEARHGIGGHCLPKDSQMYLNQTKDIIGESLVKVAKKIDVDYRRFLTQNRPPLTIKQSNEAKAQTDEEPLEAKTLKKEPELAR